jgi:GTP cyclohydrolase II
MGMSTAFDSLLDGIARAPLRADRPWITLTFAQSLDGSIGGSAGERLALSGDESLNLTHRLRAAHDAILVGVGTVLADDPRLTLRLAPGRQPQPIVLDSRLRTPPQAAILRHPHPVWLVAGPYAPAESAEALRRAGAMILTVPLSPSKGIDLPALLASLRERGVRRIMVEGGAAVLSALASARLVDLLVLTIAPVIIGGLRPFQAVDSLPLALMPHPCWAQAGDDMVVWGTPVWART